MTSSASLRRNAIANVAGRSASALLWLVVTPTSLRFLGPEGFGVWSLFFVFGGYIANLDLGVTSAVSRFVAVGSTRGDRAMVEQVLRRSLWVGGVAGLIWCLAFMLLRRQFLDWFHIPAPLVAEVTISLSVFALSMFVFSITQVLHGVLQGLQRLDLSNTFFLCGLTVHAALLLGGLHAGWGLRGAAVAMVAGHTVSGGLAAVAARRSVRRLPRAAEPGHVTWRELLGFGGAVQATNAFAVGWLQVGKVLLGTLGSLIWVTTFELGSRVALAAMSVPQLIQGAVIPAAARASAVGGEAEVRRVYAWACRWIFALAGLMLSELWLTAPALLTAWLGPGHAESAAIARSLAVMCACLILLGPATAIARGAGAPGLETATFGIALGVDIALSLWLVPRMGPQGAVLAMLISIVAAGLWLVPTVHARYGVSTRHWIVSIVAPRILIPGAVAAGLAVVGLGGGADARGAALRDLVVHGSAFLILSLALTWPTGDAREILHGLSGWLDRRRAAGVNVTGSTP